MQLHQELYRILHILLHISNHCMWNRNSRLLDYTVMEMTEGVTVQNSYDFPPLNPFYVTNFRKSYFTQAGNYLTVSTASPKNDFSYLSTVWCHIRGERTGRSVFVLHRSMSMTKACSVSRVKYKMDSSIMVEYWFFFKLFVGFLPLKECNCGPRCSDGLCEYVFAYLCKALFR